VSAFLDNEAGVLMTGNAEVAEARTKAGCVRETLNLKALEI